MKTIQSASAILFMLCMSFNSMAQKAYDNVKYIGKTQNISVEFTLANGYLEASEIKTTDLKNKKTSTFSVDPSDARIGSDLRLMHISTSKTQFTDYFILKNIEEGYTRPPKTIQGVYYFNSKPYELILKLKSK
jgi:hypothetical protein